MMIFFLSTDYYCLVYWTDEETFSNVPMVRIVSPQPDDIGVGTFVKIKSFEDFQAEVKGIGKNKSMHKMLSSVVDWACKILIMYMFTNVSYRNMPGN